MTIWTILRALCGNKEVGPVLQKRNDMRPSIEPFAPGLKTFFNRKILLPLKYQ
jgi:hypothetical protein